MMTHFSGKTMRTATDGASKKSRASMLLANPPLSGFYFIVINMMLRMIYLDTIHPFVGSNAGPFDTIHPSQGKIAAASFTLGFYSWTWAT